MNIITLLASDGYIAVNKRLLKEIGLAESVIFGLLCSEYNLWQSQGKLKEGEKFYITIDRLKENTGLSYHQQQRAIKNLEDLEFITTSIEGVPACRFFKINEDKVLNFFESSFQKTEKLDFEKLNINNNKINNNIDNNTKVLLENDECVEEHKNDALDILKKDIQKTHNKTTNSNKAKANNNNFIGSAGKKEDKKPNRFQKCIDVIDEFYPNNEKLKDLLIQYLKLLFEQYSNDDRTFYINQWRGLLNKLKTLENNGNNPMVVVQQSLDKGYKSFYQINTMFRSVPCGQEQKYINEVNEINNSTDISQQIHINKIY